MILDNLRISRKFVAAFAVLVLTCLGAGGISLASLATIERTSDAGGRGEAKLGELQKLELALMSQQNALRGFMISGAANFVADFESQRTIYLAALGRIRAMEADPDQQARLDRTAALVEEWMATSARKQLEAGRDAETRKTAAPLVSGQFFTRIRSGLAEFAALQNTTVTDLAAAEKKAAETARIATSAGALTAVTLASLLCWLLTRSIARPIEAVTIALRSLADGNEQLSLPAPGRQDELGRMTDALHVLRDAVGEKRRLEQAAEATRHEHAAQQVRIAAERESAAKDQGAVMAAVTGGIHRLSSGDLTARLDQVFPPEYETLRTDFNAALARLQTVMAEIVGNTRGLQAAAGEVSQAADDLSRRTEQQAASLEQTAAALEQVTVTVRRTAEGALEVRQVVSTARADAEQSGTVVQDAVGAMSEIEQSAREISQIIGVIDEIAFQTNLLALNAGVEAARAGDAGRGFAVVASEVRALAQRSADAAKQIKGLISTSTRQVSRGVDLVGETGKSLSRIVAQVIEVNTLVTGIAASAQEQSTGLAEVNAAVNQMDQITQQNAAMVEQSTAASHALSQDAAELARLTGQFVIGTAATERPVRSAAPKASAPRPVRRAGQAKPALAVVRTAEPNNWTEF